MAEPHAISILCKKRDSIRDTIAKYEARLKEAQADQAHDIAAMRLFEIDSNADDFPAYVDFDLRPKFPPVMDGVPCGFDARSGR